MNDLPLTEYLPVAYLPGASGSSAAWEPIANVLAYRREALIFDYPGLGAAPSRPDLNSLSDLALWVRSELPERCDLASLSVGSALTLRLALDYPECVRRLILISPCGGLNAASFGALDWRDTFIRERPHAPRWFVDEDVDLTDQLHTIRAPTLLVCGAKDPIAPPAIGQFLQERLPFAKLEVVPDAGHDVEEEHPAFIASLIEAHLRR